MGERCRPHKPHKVRVLSLTANKIYLDTFAKGDRMKASPSGDEDDVVAVDVDPLLAMDVV